MAAQEAATCYVMFSNVTIMELETECSMDQVVPPKSSCGTKHWVLVTEYLNDLVKTVVDVWQICHYWQA